MKEIKLKNVSFRYTKEKYLYEDFSINFDAGDRIGIIGANGCGKTTLMNIITGFLKPEKGCITIDEVEYDFKDNYLRSKFGVVPQEYAVIDELSAIENIRFFGMLNQIKNQELKDATEFALEFSNLHEFKNKNVGTYSGGMKRRLNMAISMMHKPEIIILDEPTVGVDPQSRNFLLDQINNIDMTNKVMFYVTHYMKEIEKTCNKVLILDSGKVLAFGNIEDILEKNTSKSVIVEGVFEIKDSDYTFISDDDTTKISGFRSFNDVYEFTQENNLSVLSFGGGNLEDVFISLTGKRLRD